jgi:hypothetical protein
MNDMSLEWLENRDVVMYLKALSGHFHTETCFIFEYPVFSRDSSMETPA